MNLAVPAVGVVARTREQGAKLLAAAPRDLGRDVAWLLVTPLDDEVARSETWTVIRYPWPQQGEDRGRLLRVPVSARVLRLGRLLADADVVSWVDAVDEKDVRAVGTIYRKISLPYGASDESFRRVLDQ